MFDMIVIGAGPAGCAAAKALAGRGCRVLLVEKFKMPRYKSCSGQLIGKSMELVQKYFGEPVPAFVTCAPAENKGMIFTDDKDRTFRFEQKGLNVWRSAFDQWLANKAAQSGAEVRDNTVALSLDEQDEAVAVLLKGEQTYTERAGYVIDCEGVTGALKSGLLNHELKVIYTYQTFNQGSVDLDYQFFHAYLQPELSGYDAWFNVKDNQLVLGVAVKEAQKAGYYHARFISYMKETHNLRVEKQLRIDKWLMPWIQPGCDIDYGIGRIFFAGETAGFLNPMGEGISSALESGHCLALAMMEHSDNLEMIYSDYKNSTEALRSYMKRQWSLVGSMAGTFAEHL